MKRKLLLIIIVLGFILRISYLTNLPIFGDESIYLSWGWTETHVPGNLYFSLYDNKQPLLMWVFGIFESLFDDPLFGGRLVSVLTGTLTLLGIYSIAKRFFSRKVALLSIFFYSIVPFFVFYDRQALMESAIAAIGVWACYFSLLLWETQLRKYAYILGLILGIGFFIKSSAILFLFSYLIITSLVILKSIKKGEIFLNTVIVITSSIVVNLLLFINPEYWSTLSKNSTYSLSIGEIVRLPVSLWIKNLLINGQIGFIYLTPLLFLISIGGSIILLKKGGKAQKLLLFWFILSILIETLLIKGASIRYLVAFLPLFVIPSAYFMHSIIQKQKVIGFMVLGFSCIIPILLTLLLIFSPAQYIFLLKKITPYAPLEYVYGHTAGYGIREIVHYLESASEGKKSFVGVALNIGNPESALRVYFAKNKHITVGFMDSSLMGENLKDIPCLSSPVKTFFVSRDNELAGLERYLHILKSFKNPYYNDAFVVHELNNNCQGTTLRLHQE